METVVPSKLSSIPRDYLCDILALLDGRALSQLWLCGDTLLCDHLRKAVKRFSLIYRLNDLPNWPTIISRFSSLESLKIVRVSPASGENSLPLFGVDPNTIPSSVRSIETKFLNDSTLFFTFETVRGSRISARKLSDCYPHLTSIKANCNIDIAQHSVLCNAKSLSGLVRLDLEQGNFVLPTSDIPNLPCTLEVLTVSIAANQTWNRPNMKFPASLTKLVISKVLSTLCLGWMPSSLTHLKVGYNRSGCTDKDANWALLKCNLAVFSIVFGPAPSVDDMKSLPPNMLSLSVFSVSELNSELVAHLPPSLTELTMLVDSEPKWFSHLPPNLKYWSRHDNLPVSCWKVLHNIQIMSFWDRMDINDIPNLPPSLTELSASCDNNMELISKLTLPELKTLIIRGGDLLHPPQFGPHFSVLTQLTLDQLDRVCPNVFDDAPFQLIALRVRHSKFHFSTIGLKANWAQKLETLVVHYTVPPKMPMALPNSLTELCLESSDMQGADQGIEPSIMENLPKGLLSLQLCITPFGPSHLQLPRFLHTLKLKGPRSIPGTTCTLHDTDLAKLPRTLTAVSLPPSPHFVAPIVALAKHLPSSQAIDIPNYKGYHTLHRLKQLTQFDPSCLRLPLKWNALDRIEGFNNS